MEVNKYITVFALLNALTICLTNISADAGQERKNSARRGGQTDAHMSANALVNTNAQWSADPVRGWVRAEERRELRNEKQSMKSKKSRGKSRGKDARETKQ